MAPDSQTEVPMILWFGRNYDAVPSAAMQAIRETPLTHDFVFHTLLGLFEIRSSEYTPTKDVLHIARDRAGIPPEYESDKS